MSHQCEISIKVSKLLSSTFIFVSSEISFKQFAGWCGNTDHTLSNTILDLFYSWVAPSHSLESLACSLDHLSFELRTVPSHKLYFSHWPCSPQHSNAKDIHNKGTTMTITSHGLTSFSGSFNPHSGPMTKCHHHPHFTEWKSKAQRG